MSKGTILSHISGALYNVRVWLERSKIDAMETYITEQLSAISIEIATQTADVVSKKTIYDSALSDLNSFIDTYDSDDILKYQSELNQLTASVYSTKSEYDSANRLLNLSKLKQKQLQSEQSNISKYCPEYVDAQAKCVDYSVNLTGDVGLVEIDHIGKSDGSSSFYILPGTNVIDGSYITPLSNYKQDRDAILQSPMATSQHATWFNLATLPAAQLEKPRYLTGTILSSYLYESNIVYDVELDPVETIGDNYNARAAVVLLEKVLMCRQCFYMRGKDLNGDGRHGVAGDRVVIARTRYTEGMSRIDDPGGGAIPDNTLFILGYIDPQRPGGYIVRTVGTRYVTAVKLVTTKEYGHYVNVESSPNKYEEWVSSGGGWISDGMVDETSNALRDVVWDIAWNVKQLDSETLEDDVIAAFPESIPIYYPQAFSEVSYEWNDSSFAYSGTVSYVADTLTQYRHVILVNSDGDTNYWIISYGF